MPSEEYNEKRRKSDAEARLDWRSESQDPGTSSADMAASQGRYLRYLLFAFFVWKPRNKVEPATDFIVCCITILHLYLLVTFA